LFTEDKKTLKLYPVKTKLVECGDDIVEVILQSLNKENIELDDNDVLAVASKILAYAQNRVINLKDVKPSQKAMELAKQFSLQPEFAELILREADKIYGGVEKAVLTLKNEVLTANAGIDNKNAPSNHVVLWPSDTEKWAKNIREEIKKRTGKLVGVIIVDSGLMPLRIGTTGLALAVAGFKPIRDFRDKKDIYGRPIAITRHAVADDLASAAHLLMSETTEKTPIVIIRDAPVDFDNGAYGSADMAMPSNECIFMSSLGHS